MDLVSGLLAQSEPQGFVKIVDQLARAPLSKVLLFAAVLTLARVLIFPTLQKTPQHLRHGAYSGLRFVNEMADALIYAAIVVFMLIRPFGIQTFFIPSASMVDTLRLNDYIVANKFIYRFSEPHHGDIVVFKPPAAGLMPGQSLDDTDFIKRLIGEPGDVIEYKNKVLYRNGQKIDEPYVDFTDDLAGYETVLPKERWAGVSIPDFKVVQDGDKVIPLSNLGGVVNSGPPFTSPVYRIDDPFLGKKLADSKPITIPQGWYLMMGDNRNGSYDGRAWGLVPRESIVGKAWFIWLPVNRIRGL